MSTDERVQADQTSLNIHSSLQEGNLSILACMFEQNTDSVTYFVDIISSMSPESRERITRNLEKTLEELYKNKNKLEQHRTSSSEENNESFLDDTDVDGEEYGVDEDIRWRTLSALSEANQNFSLIFMNLLGRVDQR